MTCPSCGLENLSSAVSCDCGYAFCGVGPQSERVKEARSRIEEERDRKFMRAGKLIGIADLLLLAGLTFSLAAEPGLQELIASGGMISTLVALLATAAGQSYGKVTGIVVGAAVLFVLWAAILGFGWWLAIAMRSFHLRF